MDQVNTLTEENTESGYHNDHAICIDMQQILTES